MMHWRFVIKSTLCLLAALLVAGCVQTTEPLSPFAPLPADSPLAGTWKTVHDDEVSYLHIGSDADAVRLVTVDLDKKGTLRNQVYRAAWTRVGTDEYLSVREAGRDNKFYLVKCELSGDTLTLWFPDYPYVARAIEDGVIAGRARTAQLFPEVLLTAGPEALRNFLRAHGSKAFTAQMATLRRVTP